MAIYVACGLIMAVLDKIVVYSIQYCLFHAFPSLGCPVRAGVPYLCMRVNGAI